MLVKAQNKVKYNKMQLMLWNTKQKPEPMNSIFTDHIVGALI